MPPHLVIPSELRQIEVWPAVAFTAIPETKRAQYLAREDALRRYIAGESIALIHKSTSIARGQLYRLLKRCLAKHPDGRIFGFRGLLSYHRVKGYDRRKPVLATASPAAGGSSGAMTQLLDRFVMLRSLIERAIRNHTVTISASGRLQGLRSLHKAFLAECTELGIAPHQYPFNRLQEGKRSLAQVTKNIMDTSFQSAARAAGAERIAPPWHDGKHSKDTSPATLRPFEVAEFDGHKLDIRLRVRLEDPFGLTYDLELRRVWILVVLDVCTRAVLGWNVVLAPEYDRYDVIKTMQNALKPRARRSHFSISKLTYQTGAGFVSQSVPVTAHACWDWLRLDNARANLAADTLNALCDFLGCNVDAGPVREPNERPYIERFFGTIGEALSHRLPGSTGHSADDVRRRLSDPGGDTELLVTFPELEELLDVTIANYNGTAHSAIPGRSPLEAMRYFVLGKRSPLRHLPEVRRRDLFLMQPAYECIVRGSKASGKRPHISFYGSRYSSLVLSQAAHLVGSKIHVYFDPLDLRLLQAFLPNGAELGPLTANAPWHHTAHSLRLRREILRLKRRGDLTYGDSDDPVAAYLENKRKQSSKKQRRSSHRIAEAATALSTAEAAPVNREPAIPAKPTPPTKPRRLVIGDKAQS
jgi:putative transposase